MRKSYDAVEDDLITTPPARWSGKEIDGGRGQADSSVKYLGNAIHYPPGNRTKATSEHHQRRGVSVAPPVESKGNGYSKNIGKGYFLSVASLKELKYSIWRFIVKP